ncbi:MAG: hypothetical protein HC813_00285 [Planctomycetes bacterium]|nr:hypothetical protein [Planctomycetota bacterium]
MTNPLSPRRRWALGLGLLLVPFALTLLSRPEARADPADEAAAGWTVEQGGQVTTYLWKERWRGYPNPAGFTVTNEGTLNSVYYYGTFKVTERRR